MSHHYIKSDDPRVQAHIERLERRDKTVEHLFRRCLHLLEQAIAGITLIVLIISLGMELVDTVVVAFDAFLKTSMRFDEVFLADNVDTGEWFFGTLQPRYNKFRNDIDVLNEAIHKELQNNSADFDAGFYRSIIPGVVSVGAGLLMIFLLLYFIMVNYVNPIYRMSDGIDAYKATGRMFVYSFDGDDQLANVNEGLTDLIEENTELKRRIKALREKE